MALESEVKRRNPTNRNISASKRIRLGLKPLYKTRTALRAELAGLRGSRAECDVRRLSGLDWAKPMRVLIAGGGTGGHVIPALAIARELQAHYKAEILFVGTARGIENRLVPQAGFGLMRIKVGVLKGVSLWKRLRTMLGLPLAVLESRKIIRVFAPDVVVGVGGYASGPAMAAAILAKIPTLAFEPNVVPGLANRWVGHRVSAAAVHFDETAKYFRNVQVVGVPVRADFFQQPASAENTKGPPTLLVFGGSQGAHAISVAVIGAVPAIQKAIPGLRVIHQTGERDYNEVQAAYASAGVAAEV